MDITLEQVEQLKEKADVSYAKAKEALEYSRGNLLDALIYLEEQGEIPIPEGTRYSTWNPVPPASPPSASAPPAYQPIPPSRDAAEQRPPRKAKREKGQKGPGWFTRLRWLLLDNELEIWRKEEPVTALPFLILILLLVSLPWVSIPLLILGLFLGFRYRFSGPDLEREEINGVMGSVADTAADLGRRMADEIRTQSAARQASPQARTQPPQTQQEPPKEETGTPVPPEEPEPEGSAAALMREEA